MRLDTRPEVPLDPAPQGDDALHWLGLLDQLYALVEHEGGAAMGAGALRAWPEAWRPVIAQWARHIGARSIQVSAARALQSPGCDAGLVSHRRITGEAIVARSLSPEGFSPAQVRAFHAFCSHLDAACALRTSLDATQASLAALHGVIDALPTGLVVLDEHGEVALLNRPGREWLARTARASLQARRLRLSAQHDAFERALHTFARSPAMHLPLQLNGLELQLKKLPGPAFSVLLLVHEHADPTRLREIATPPALLAAQVRRQYALTDKELPLAWNLAQGMPLKQYAGLSGRSIETVRAQLKSIFRKLGTPDQKGLGVVLFETLHAVTLQAVGTGLAPFVAEPAPLAPERLPWP